MKLPVHDPEKPGTRSKEEVRALAVAIQANLVQLKTNAERRAGNDWTHGIETVQYRAAIQPGGRSAARVQVAESGVLPFREGAWPVPREKINGTLSLRVSLSGR